MNHNLSITVSCCNNSEHTVSAPPVRFENTSLPEANGTKTKKSLADIYKIQPLRSLTDVTLKMGLTSKLCFRP